MTRALSVDNITNYRPVSLPFEGKWAASFGCPERRGSWLVWGNPGNGKTRFTLQLCKYLCQFEKVVYNSLEEGLSMSMKKAILDVGMKEAGRRFFLLDMEPLKELEARLEKKKSFNIVVIDSLQYLHMTQADYIRWKKKFPNKLFIFISHAKGKEPKGSLAESIRYDAFVKIWVEGYKAFLVNRYANHPEDFVIWSQGASEYWGGQEEGGEE